MSSVILKGFGNGHSRSPAKEMAEEKLSEVKMRSHLLTCFEKKQLTISFPNERKKAMSIVFVLSNAGNRTLLYLPHARDLYGDSGTTCNALDCSSHKKWIGFVCLVCN